MCMYTGTSECSKGLRAYRLEVLFNTVAGFREGASARRFLSLVLV